MKIAKAPKKAASENEFMGKGRVAWKKETSKKLFLKRSEKVGTMNPTKMFGVQKRPDLLSAIVRARIVDRGAIVGYLKKVKSVCEDQGVVQNMTIGEGLKLPSYFKPLWDLMTSLGKIRHEYRMTDIIDPLRYADRRKPIVQAIATEPGRRSLRALEDAFKTLGDGFQNSQETKSYIARKALFDRYRAVLQGAFDTTGISFPDRMEFLQKPVFEKVIGAIDGSKRKGFQLTLEGFFDFFFEIFMIEQDSLFALTSHIARMGLGTAATTRIFGAIDLFVTTTPTSSLH
jgi:hypothetical protein